MGDSGCLQYLADYLDKKADIGSTQNLHDRVKSILAPKKQRGVIRSHLFIPVQQRSHGGAQMFGSS